VAQLLPVLPSPVTWGAGIIPAYQLRSDVSDAIALLAKPPIFIGNQTTTGQVIASGITTPNLIVLDTEVVDNWNGHQISTFPAQYFGQFQGWYLCECTFPLQYTGGTGSVAAGIQYGTTGASTFSVGGMRVENSSGFRTICGAAKLVNMVNVGGAFATGDWVGMWASQSSGTGQAPTETASRFPSLSVRWVAANSGTNFLAVPVNAAWPVPPSFVTSSFLNTNIRDTINFLTYPPVMEYSLQTGGFNISSQSAVPTLGQTVVLDTPTVDNYFSYNIVSGAWTAPSSGVYYVYGCFALLTGANQVATAAGLTITSSNYNGGTPFTWWGGAQSAVVSGTASVQTRRRLRLNGGDTIELAAFQNDSGGANASCTSTGLWLCRLITVWESA
jgi:hypothetical protein